MDAWFAVLIPVKDTSPISYGAPVAIEVFLTKKECLEFWSRRNERGMGARGRIILGDKYDTKMGEVEGVAKQDCIQMQRPSS